MLEYGLPAAPEGWRWYIRIPKYSSKDRRNLYLEKFVPGTLFTKDKWVEVHNHQIFTYAIEKRGFEAAVRESAETILRDVNVNFNLPTGEVR